MVAFFSHMTCLPCIFACQHFTFVFCVFSSHLLSERVARKATNIPRRQLLALGVRMGHFTHKKKAFQIDVTCLDLLSPLALHKVWIKSSAEMSFLYGHHISKQHVSRVTSDIPHYGGVIVYNTHDTPLGFGLLSQPQEKFRMLGPSDQVILHQADIGEYLRDEDELS